MNRKSGAARSSSAQGFTEKQGQYLAFIYTYSHMFRRPPAETDMQRHFQVSPPSVHMWTAPYVDGPRLARIGWGYGDRIACAHMSGLRWGLRPWPRWASRTVRS